MSDRRINPNANGEHQSKLKQIAGLLQGLSYTEMKAFSNLIRMEIDPNDTVDVADCLLAVSQRILTEEKKS